MSEITVLKIKNKGFCVFSNRTYNTGELIGEYISPQKNDIGRFVKDNLWETVLGRFCNHWTSPNTTIVLNGETYFLVAIENIEIGDEITVNYDSVEQLLSFDCGFFTKVMETQYPPLKKYGN